MLEKVFYTSVLVSDQDKALDFYTNVVGLEKRVENPTPDGPRFLTVGVEGDDFQLVLWPGTPGRAQPAMGRPPASITIETDDCRKTVEQLKSRGVEFVSDVLEFPWGAMSRSSRTPTATACNYDRAANPRAEAARRLVAPGAAEIEHLSSAGVAGARHLSRLRSAYDSSSG
jgi:predicted enzyme related to lactoylglutathione lyase